MDSITWSDPDGWFQMKGSVNYPIGANTDEEVYGIYRIATKTEKGVTTVDYTKSTISFIQKTGVNGWNGFTTLPVKITDVTFVKDTSGPLASITFESPKFDPQTPGGFTDDGLKGTIDFTKGTGSITDTYTEDATKKVFAHVSTITSIPVTMFDVATLPPAVAKVGGNVQKSKIPGIPPPLPSSSVPEPASFILLAGGLALLTWARVRVRGLASRVLGSESQNAERRA
jgi:hypothetical protein